jgi:hypothetical protein
VNRTLCPLDNYLGTLRGHQFPLIPTMAVVAAEDNTDGLFDRGKVAIRMEDFSNAFTE